MDMQKLKEAASAVLGWSNCDKAWLDTSEDESAAVLGHIDEDGNTYPVATIDCDQYYQGQDSLKLARFYAAANPAKVLYLITEIEQLRAENNRLKAENKLYAAEMSAAKENGFYSAQELFMAYQNAEEELAEAKKDAELWREREARIKLLKERGFLGSPLRSEP